jgi:hypothetical protein
MAFDFLGTFTGSQFTRFQTFLQAQLAQVSDRINHANAELNRIGAVAFTYDSGGIPQMMNNGAVPGGVAPYATKLLFCYEALGGDAQFDLQTRLMNQPVFRLTGDETHMPQQMSNGEIIGKPGLSDGETATAMQQARSWVQDMLTYRREILERKILRAMDYADQLTAEVAQLQTIQASAQTNGSLAFLIANIQSFIANPNYQAASNDSAMPDPYGKLAYAPFASYEPGPDRELGTDFQRTTQGPAVPTGNT